MIISSIFVRFQNKIPFTSFTEFPAGGGGTQLIHGRTRPSQSTETAVGKASPILFTLTSRSGSDVESSNVSLKKVKPDGV